MRGTVAIESFRHLPGTLALALPPVSPALPGMMDGDGFRADSVGLVFRSGTIFNAWLASVIEPGGLIGGAGNSDVAVGSAPCTSFGRRQRDRGRHVGAADCQPLRAAAGRPGQLNYFGPLVRAWRA